MNRDVLSRVASEKRAREHKMFCSLVGLELTLVALAPKYISSFQENNINLSFPINAIPFLNKNGQPVVNTSEGCFHVSGFLFTQN